MKISTMFAQQQPVISFEIFPPKPEYPVSTIFETLEGLKSLEPAFVSVTYGAGGSSSATSFLIADKVKNTYGLETLTHFTCVGARQEEVDNSLTHLREIGVENILALRGDFPPNQSAETMPGDYQYAKDLIAHIRQETSLCIGAAAYPEGHLECRAQDLNLAYLQQKVAAGADFFITQLFFDNALYYSFWDAARKAGIDRPISVGIMPVLSAGQIKRICTLCGASIPAQLTAILDRYGANAYDMEQAGIEYACKQIEDLLAHNVDGIHLYTMNKYNQTKTIMTNLNLRR